MLLNVSALWWFVNGVVISSFGGGQLDASFQTIAKSKSVLLAVFSNRGESLQRNFLLLFASEPNFSLQRTRCARR